MIPCRQTAIVHYEKLANLNYSAWQEQMEEKVEKMGRQAMCRRILSHFQEGVREKCIDKANEAHAARQYRLICCRKIMHILRMATHRACLIRRAYDRQCKVHDFTKPFENKI